MRPHAGDGTASIHDLEQSLRLDARPPIDAHDRAIGVECLMPADTTADGLEAGTVVPVRSWARERMSCTVRTVDGEVRILLAAADTSLVKELRISPDGSIAISWRWTPSTARWFASELSLAAPLQALAEPIAELVTYPSKPSPSPRRASTAPGRASRSRSSGLLPRALHN